MKLLLLLCALSLLVSAALAQSTAAPADVAVSPQCSDAIAELIARTYPNETLLMLYSGRGPRDLGNFDECQALHIAHYCLLTIQTNVAMLATGLCAPSVCSASDLNLMSHTFLKALNVTLPEQDITKVRCITKEEIQPPTAGGSVVLAFIGLLLLIAFIGTGIEYVEIHQKNMEDLENSVPRPRSDDMSPSDEAEHPLIQSLNPINSTSLILSDSEEEEKLLAQVHERNLSVLNGLRVLSMFWIILGHTISFTSGAWINVQYVFQNLVGTGPFMLIPAAEFAVDTFFYMSGFLVAYLTLKALREKGSLNWGLFYFHRFWRIIPPLLLMMLIWWKVSPIFINGPISIVYSVQVMSCDSYWWSTLLHVQNFFPAFLDTCVGWTWYLANDMQFYIISPLLIFLYYKFPKLGLSFILVLMTASFIVSGVLHVDRNYYARSLNAGPNWTDVIYTKPYIRITPYLVGVLFGFLYLSIESRRKMERNPAIGRLPLWLEVILVLLALGGMATLIFVTLPNYGPEPWAPNAFPSILWNVLARPGWAVCVAVLMHLYFTDHGILFGRILSADFWAPLARLTFSAYLYHPVVMIGSISSFKAYIHYDGITMTVYTLGWIVASYVVAFGSFVLVERPLVNLEKLILPSHR